MSSASRMRRGAGLVGAFTMASRVLGLAREMLQSRIIGAGAAQSAFVFAFMLPNLSRRLFGEGALTSAFLPVFKAKLESGRRDEALRLARTVSTMVTLLLGSVVLVGVAGLTAFLAARGSGASEAGAASARVFLICDLARILLPYAVFICGAAFGMAMLNATGRFFASSFVPCLLNVVWIAALGVLAFASELSAVAKTTVVAWAVLGAGMLQSAFMLAALRRAGMPLRPSLRGWRDESTRLVWRNTGIAAVGAGAVQISTALDQALAQIAAPWAAAALAYADRLFELPLAVVGTAFGTVLLPTLSGHFAKGDVEGARAAFADAVRDLVALLLPAAAAVVVLAPDVVAAIYQGGAFGRDDAVRVSRALVCYAPGLVVFGLNKALVPWFHAQMDVRTPVRVSLWMVGANAAMNVAAAFALPVEWRHSGMACATVATSAATTVVLARLARRRNGPMGWRPLVRSLAPSALAALAMALALAALRFFAFPAPAVTPGERFCRLAAEIAIGGAVWATLSPLPRRLAARLARRFLRR